jgi:hypothetical protein
MERDATRFYLSKRQEKNLLHTAAAAVRTDFPNPDHRGCPDPSAVRKLARRSIPLRETADLVDHIATCAPCFDVYTRFRRHLRLARAGGPILLVVAGLVALMAWWPHSRTPGPHQQERAQVTTAVPIENAMLDFREMSAARSAETGHHSEPPPRIRKAYIELTILLPLGSDDGEYSLELRNSAGAVLISAPGAARWDGAAEKLITRLDLRGLAKGEYALALRQGDSSWRTYDVILEDVR